MTILEYIQSKVRVSLSADNVSALMLDRGLAGGTSTDAATYDYQTRELLYADSLMLIATSPTSIGSATQQHGEFILKTASESFASVDKYIQTAMDIYKKWSDDKYVVDESLSWIDNDY